MVYPINYGFPEHSICCEYKQNIFKLNDRLLSPLLHCTNDPQCLFSPYSSQQFLQPHNSIRCAHFVTVTSFLSQDCRTESPHFYRLCDCGVLIILSVTDCGLTCNLRHCTAQYYITSGIMPPATHVEESCTNNSYTLTTEFSCKPRLPVLKLLTTWLTSTWMTEVLAAQCIGQVVSCVAVILYTSMFCNSRAHLQISVEMST